MWPRWQVERLERDHQHEAAVLRLHEVLETYTDVTRFPRQATETACGILLFCVQRRVAPKRRREAAANRRAMRRQGWRGCPLLGPLLSQHCGCEEAVAVKAVKRL